MTVLIFSLVLFNFYNAHALTILEPIHNILGLESYKITFTSPVYMCSDDLSQAFADTSRVEAHRHNESYSYIVGDIQTFKPIEDGTMLEVITEVELHGSYEVMALLDSCDFCKELGNPDSFFADFFQYIDIPKSCPILPGIYHMKNLVPDKKKFHVNVVTAGRYLVSFNIKENPTKNCLGKTKFIACFKVEVMIEPQ